MDFEAYFQTKSLVKTPRVGVHYEQKITPDLIWCVAHVVRELVAQDPQRTFTDKDVRESPVFNALMQDYFSKAPQEGAENEYNKLSSYQLGVLVFAGVLTQVGMRPKTYQVVQREILEYVAVNDFNARSFLCAYTIKFIADNGLSPVFESYQQTPSQDTYQRAKEAYWQWAQVNTAVKGNDRRHTYRVFNKIFNVFCYAHRIPGEDASNVVPGPCPYAFLIYNRENFRDKDMPTGMTRERYQQEVLAGFEQDGVVETLLQKVKNAMKVRYHHDSEIKDPTLGYLPGAGVHVHHILPQHSYSQFSLTKENLICLTPGQHYSFAHVAGNTRTINPDFQQICLKTKFAHIKESLQAGEDFYDLREFAKVLTTCFGWQLSENPTLEEIEERLADL